VESAVVTPLAAGLAAVAAALAVAPLGRRPPSPRRGRSAPWATRPPFRRHGRPDGTPTAGRPTGWAIGSLSAVVGLAALAVAGPIAAVLASVAVLVARRSRRRRAAQARADRLDRMAAEVLAAFAAELAAGLPPAPALDAAIGTTITDAEPAMAAVHAALRSDLDPTATLTTSGIPALRDLAAAWHVSHTEGMRLGPIADRLAAVMRAEVARSAELSAALAGPRASGRLLAVLPVAGIGLGGLAGASPVHFLLRTPIGGACALAGMTLELAGLAWLNRMAARAGAWPEGETDGGAPPVTASGSAGSSGAVAPFAARAASGGSDGPRHPATRRGGPVVPAPRRPV
jgi:tight adherence protein B